MQKKTREEVKAWFKEINITQAEWGRRFKPPTIVR